MASHNFSTENVLCGMVMNVNHLDKKLQEILQEVQWTEFLSLSEPVYYTLVGEFWFNAKIEDEGIITSEVNGTKVGVTPNSLAEVTGYKERGILYTNTWSNMYNSDEISMLLCMEVDDTIIIWNKEMSTPARFLHHIVADCVCPRPRLWIRDQLTDEEKFMVFHIMRKVKIDLNEIIFGFMKKIIMENNGRTTLPYGMLLTKIFNTHNINLEGQFPDRECGPRILFDYNIEDITYSRLTPTSGISPPFLEIKEVAEEEEDDDDEDDEDDDSDESDSSYSENNNDDDDDRPLVIHTIKRGGGARGIAKESDDGP